jgi:hypothetical protein
MNSARPVGFATALIHHAQGHNLAEASPGTSSEVSNVDSVVGAVGRTTQVPEAVDRSARDIRSTTETLNRAVDRFLDEVAAA